MEDTKQIHCFCKLYFRICQHCKTRNSYAE